MYSALERTKSILAQVASGCLCFVYSEVVVVSCTVCGTLTHYTIITTTASLRVCTPRPPRAGGGGGGGGVCDIVVESADFFCNTVLGIV